MYKFVSLVVLPDIYVVSHAEALRKGVLFCFFNRSKTKVECKVPLFYLMSLLLREHQSTLIKNNQKKPKLVSAGFTLKNPLFTPGV